MPSGGGTISASPPFMLIDMARPATEAASLTTATVRWLSAPASGCTAAFKIKFLRPALANTQFSVIAERGPFNAVNGINVVTLSPAVAVQPRDVIGVTQLKPLSGCGGVAFSRVNGAGATHTSSHSDPASGLVNDTAFGYESVMNARASSSADVIEGYLAGLGSGQGGFGSFFRTAVQLTNADFFSTITGKFVFHPAGVAASPSDPTLPFTIAPEATVHFPDIVAAMGRSGLGSVDVVTTNSFPPIITTRAFNDQGPSGTSGLTLEMTRPEDALQANHFADLTLPADPTNFRMNIGIRSLNAGVSINIFARNASGVQISSATRSYPPNFFEQISLADFINTATLPPNGAITVNVNSGSAIIYGSTTDNRTNDPSVKFFTRY